VSRLPAGAGLRPNYVAKKVRRLPLGSMENPASEVGAT